MLIALGKHAGQVLSREQLMEMAFEDPCAVDARGVDIAVFRLRRALGQHAEMVRTVPRIGYKLALTESAAWR